MDSDKLASGGTAETIYFAGGTILNAAADGKLPRPCTDVASQESPSPLRGFAIKIVFAIGAAFLAFGFGYYYAVRFVVRRAGWLR